MGRSPGDASRKAGAAQGMVILLASVLPVMGVVLISPIAPVLRAAFADRPGGDYLAAAALTAPALAVAACSPFIGVLIDKIGSRRVLISALAAYAGLGVAPMWLDDITMLVGARLALGVAEAAILTANFALVAGYFEGERRTRWIAYKSSAAAVGATAFYILGGVLGEISWRAPFAAYGVSLLIALAAMAVVFEPSRAPPPVGEARRPVARGGSVATVAVLCLVTVCSAVLFYVIPIQFAVLLAEGGVASPAKLGMLIAVAGLGNPIGAFACRFLTRTPTALVMGLAGTIAAIGMVIAATAQTSAMMVAGAFVNQLGCGAFVPAMASATMHALPPDRRGVGGGGWVTSFFGGQFLCPLFVAWVIGVGGGARGGFIALALITLGFGAVAAAVLWSTLGGGSGPRKAQAAAGNIVEMER